MVSHLRRGVVALLVAALTLTLADAAFAASAKEDPKTHPYGIADHLRLEAIGRAVADPSGRWLVWEQAPPYDQLPDYSMPEIGAWGRAGFRLMAVDLSETRPQALFLFEPDPRASYWIDSFSPDGQWLAFILAKAGRIWFGLYDMGRDRTTLFNFAPRIHAYQGHRSTWISNHDVVVAAWPDGLPPPSLAVRRYTGERLYREWTRAWAGGESASVVVSRADGGGGAPLPGRLIAIDAETGVTRTLATGAFETLALSHDGRYLAALRQTERVQPDPRARDVDWISARSQLVLFDLLSGRDLRCFAAGKEVFPETLFWSPKSSRLAFFAWDKGTGVQSGQFHVLDAETGRVTPYPHYGLDLASQRERGLIQKPERAVWIGDRLAVFARARASGERAPRFTYRNIAGEASGPAVGKADWFLIDAAGRAQNLTAPFSRVWAIPLGAIADHLFLLADGNIWRVGPGDAPVNLTVAIDDDLTPAPVAQHAFSHDSSVSDTILVAGKEGSRRVVLADLQAGWVRTFMAPASDAALLAGSVAAGAVLFRHDRSDGTALILKYANGREIFLDRLNTHLAAVTRTVWMPFRHRAYSGRTVQNAESCLLLPPGYERGKRYPLIVEVYPVRRPGCGGPSWRRRHAIGHGPGPYSEHLLAARGFIVVRPDTSRGQAQPENGPLGGLTSQVLSVVDALIEQGYADPKRVGLMGVSQGGFAALWLATQSDRFKAVVAINGWSDMYSHYFEADLYRRFYAAMYPYMGSAARYEAAHGTDFAIGKSPWDDPDAYVRNSPLFLAPKITAPILLIHSDMDNFTLSQYERMFTALYRQRKEARFVRYWGEGHLPSSPSNIRHMWNEIFAWYDRFMGGEADRAPPASKGPPTLGEGSG